jgi:rod shape-determining protein MreD
LTEVIFLLLAGAAAMGLQVTSLLFLAPPNFRPDFMLILVVWASLRSSFTIGMVFSFVAGILTDMLSGSPLGLFALMYFMVFLAGEYIQSTIEIDTPLGRAAMVLAAVWVVGIAVLAMRWITGPTEMSWPPVGFILLRSVVTAAAGFVVIPILNGSQSRYLRLVGEA